MNDSEISLTVQVRRAIVVDPKAVLVPSAGCPSRRRQAVVVGNHGIDATHHVVGKANGAVVAHYGRASRDFGTVDSRAGDVVAHDGVVDFEPPCVVARGQRVAKRGGCVVSGEHGISNRFDPSAAVGGMW